MAELDFDRFLVNAKEFFRKEGMLDEQEIEKIDRDWDVFSDGCLDSMGFIEFLTHIEKDVGVEIDFSLIDFEDISTIGDILSASFSRRSPDTCRVGERMEITIREVAAPEDFQRMEGWLAQPRIWKYLGPPFAHGEYKKQHVAFAIKRGQSKLYIFSADGEPVGFAGFSDIDGYNHRANFWYAMANPEFTGRGVTGRACAMIFERGLGELDLHTASAWVIGPNHASHKILLRLGFEEYGVQKEAFLFEDRYVDIHRYNRIVETAAG